MSEMATNTSIFEAFERMWQHTTSALADKETAGAAAQALTDANAYTDAEIKERDDAIVNLNELVGDTPVSDQITEAIDQFNHIIAVDEQNDGNVVLKRYNPDDASDGVGGYQYLGEVSADESIDDFIGTLTEEGRYRISYDGFIYSVIVERPNDTTIGQTYWSTEEGLAITYYRTGWANGDSWEYSEATNFATASFVQQNYAEKGHTHTTKIQVSSFTNWINTYSTGSFEVFDTTSKKYYIVEQWTYALTAGDDWHRVQEYFEMTEPWKVYIRHGTTPFGSSVSTWEEWHSGTPIFNEYKYLGEFAGGDPTEIMNGMLDDGKFRFSDGEFVYSVTVERPSDGIICQTYWSEEEGIQYTYCRQGWSYDGGTSWTFDDWDWYMAKENANSTYALKDHTHDFTALQIPTEEKSNAREDLSALGFVTGQYNTVEEFIEAITSAGNYSKVLQTAFRFKDLTGWCPLGVANLWYQGIATWQNNPNSDKYNVDAVILIWNGVNSTMYRGTVRGNYTNGLTLAWKQVFDQDAVVPIYNGGTGAKTVSAARANLGLNPVKLWAGNQNTGSLTFDYGPYQFYLIRGFTSGFVYSTMIILAVEVSSAVSSWRLPLGDSNALVFKLNRVTETAEDGSETRYVKLELDATNNTGSVMAVWGFN